jgi:hypothetical protein
MTVEQHDTVDFVAHDKQQDVALLVRVEDRDWGEPSVLRLER